MEIGALIENNIFFLIIIFGIILAILNRNNKIWRVKRRKR